MLAALEQEFLNPSSEYTPIPFWFWNDELSEEEIERQMEAFKEKGVDGFVIHPRMGLPRSIPYLSETYFQYVTYAVKCAEAKKMKVVLYDEAMYPSGSCHGMVVKENEAFASQGLKMTEDGQFIQVPTHGTIRGVHYGEDDHEPDVPASTDLLNPEAVACFIKLTHDQYYKHLKHYFGDTIVAMFTDEPNIMGRCADAGLIPWSNGILEEFIKNGGAKEQLRYLFEDKETEIGKKVNAIYKKTIYDRMAASYYKQIANWCEAHHIAMTGHPEKSTDIGYLKYFTIPCQDVVWRFIGPEEDKGIKGEHSTMGKCSADSARHYQKRRNGNECFGCCQTPGEKDHITKEDMKWYLDWLFVRGVNLIYPHAFYYSMRGRRKEERPPEVGMHSGFWEEYKQITDYIKRMSWLLTDVVNQAQIAILCSAEELSWQAARPLFEHQMEFNYLEAEQLSECTVKEGCIRIAAQTYSVVIKDKEYDEKTEEKIEMFKTQGVKVLDLSPKQEIIESGEWIQELKDIYKHDLITESFEPGLRYTHLKKKKAEFILLTNEGEEHIQTKILIPGKRIMEIWDAEFGTIDRLNTEEESYELSLPRRKSLIMVVENLKR